MKLPDEIPRSSPSMSMKEGWGEHVRWHARRRLTPRVPEHWKRLSIAERDRFDELRCTHHNSFGPVLTPELEDLSRALCELAVTNLRPTSGARVGAVIDGRANLGKTTVLTYFGCEYELALRRRYGEVMAAEYGAEWHPVVYHTLGAPTTVKTLNAGIANFYGALVPKNANTHRLTEIVTQHAQKCATTLFLIDDIHYLDLNHKGAREVNNHLKMLAAETSATFVYAGIGCLESGLFAEGRPTKTETFGQTRGRFCRLPIEPFKTETEEGKTKWQRLVKSFENELVLLEGHEGMCTNLAPYLYERTGGVVGSLSNLLRRGAARAIDCGEEKITRRVLEEVELDQAAQEGLKKRRRSPRQSLL